MQWEMVARVLAAALGAIDAVLGAIQKHGANQKALEGANAALAAISAIVEAVKKGDLEEFDAAQAEVALAELVSGLKANDAAATEAVADKFDSSDVKEP